MTNKKTGRPGGSSKWTHSSPLKICLTEHDEIEYTTTNKNGYPKFTHSKHDYVKKPCTVIIGKKEVNDGEIKLSSNDDVWTSIINQRGNLTSLGVGYPNEEITVIIHK